MAIFPLAATPLLFYLGGLDGVAAFSTLRHRPCRTSSPTSLFAGFGASSKAKVPSKKSSKKKPKSAGILGELEAAPAKQREEASSGPKLDRFGLPIPTEDDIFPPLESDVIRTPIDAEVGFNREEVAEAIKEHLGVNLDLFGEDGLTDDHQGGGSAQPNRWSLNLLHRDPPVFTIENFFTQEECEAYRSMVEPANVNADGGPPKVVQITSPTFSSASISRRTSTTWFCRYDGVPTLLCKAKQLLNVDLSQMEEPQIVRYRTGEEFSWHYDEIPSTQLSNGGQRIATLLVYLNDLDEDRGGGTIFRDLTEPASMGAKDGKRKGSKRSSAPAATKQLTVRPKTGTALLFFPSYKDGTPDIRTLHKGEVALDTKMIAQLWIHEREYRAGVPERNLQSDAVEGVASESKRLGFS